MRICGAVDIGGTNTRVALIGIDGEILRFEQIKTPVSGEAEGIAEAVSDILIRMVGDELSLLEGIGIAAAGPIDTRAGTLISPPNIPFDHVPLTGPIRRLTDRKTRLTNDCRAAVLGEVKAGGGVGYSHVVYITISTGIGGGVFTGGKVITGRNGNASEIGHFPVDSKINLTCSCGNSGHWEGYASGKGIVSFFQEWCRIHAIPAPFDELSAEIILTAADKRHPVAEEFLRDLAIINGRGLSAVIVAYDPECIIFDGAVIRHHPELLDAAVEKTDRYLDLPFCLMSPLEGNAPLIGAAMTIFYPDSI